MAQSTAARRMAAPDGLASEDFREEIIQAIARLNHRSNGAGWWTPTNLQHELELMEAERRKLEPNMVSISRSTVGMRLAVMRDEQILAFETLINAGAIKGTPGYRYGLIGTPPSGDPRRVANEAELEERAMQLAREAAATASLKKPKPRRKTRVANGRVPVSTTADAVLWQETNKRVLSAGVPKAKVLDAVLRYYIENGPKDLRGARGPYDHTRRYLPTPSTPRVAASA